LHLLWRLVLVGGIPIKGEEKPFSTRHAALPFQGPGKVNVTVGHQRGWAGAHVA